MKSTTNCATPIFSLAPLGAGFVRAGRSLKLRVTLLAALGAVLGGCGGAGLQPSGGGLAQGDGARLSAVVAQTRAQFPKLSAPDLPYSSQELPVDDASRPESVLRGEAVSVQPGVQMGAPLRARVSLFLAKPGYDRGFVKLAFGPGGDGSREETWEIVAFEKRGRADDAFEFTYLLNAPPQPLRYLVVIGGRFKEGKEEFAALEGTLIFPGAGADIDRWRRALKVNFGRRFPVAPAYLAQVDEAERLFGALKRQVPALMARSARIEKIDGELEPLRKIAGDAALAPKERADIEKREARLAEMKSRQAADKERAERELTSYFGLRGAIATAYAAFTASNQYSWASAGAQQDFFDAWKVVEYHHPKIDELSEAFAGLQDAPQKLRAVRAAAMKMVKDKNNWGRNPSHADK